MRNNRIIPVVNGDNFRDLGGYQTQDGHTIKWHKVFRAGHLANLNMSDQQKLIEAGVTVDIDLRSTAELAQFPDCLPNGVKFKHLPILDDDETESIQATEKLRRQYATDQMGGYRQMLTAYQRLADQKQVQQAYHCFFKYLLRYGENVGILFHCSAGKDRTGFLTVLLLSLLGVQPRQILADYLLTNRVSQRRIATRVYDAQKAEVSDAFVQSVRDLSVVQDSYLYQALYKIKVEYGGMQNYLNEVVGITIAEMTRLKEIYLN